MTVSNLRMSVPREKKDDILRTLRMVTGPTRAHLNCISCQIYQDLEDENYVPFVQKWESWKALDKYIRSDEYKKILAVMELASEPPDIKFVEALKTDGMELIEEIRG